MTAEGLYTLFAFHFTKRKAKIYFVHEKTIAQVDMYTARVHTSECNSKEIPSKMH